MPSPTLLRSSKPLSQQWPSQPPKPHPQCATMSSGPASALSLSPLVSLTPRKLTPLMQCTKHLLLRTRSMLPSSSPRNPLGSATLTHMLQAPPPHCHSHSKIQMAQEHSAFFNRGHYLPSGTWPPSRNGRKHRPKSSSLSTPPKT
jgi:hypothetical protein